MNNPGIIDLGDYAVTAAVTDRVITSGSNAQGAAQAFKDKLQGMAGLTLSCELRGGTGGSTIVVKVQTSIDQGTNWLDIARFDFATTAKIKVANLTGQVGKAVTEYAVLAAEGVLDNVMGDRLRAIVTSSGTYTGNTSVSVRGAAR